MRTLAAAIAAFIATSLATPAFAQAGGLQVSPVLIDILAERGTSSFRLRNTRQSEAAFEIEVFAWSQEDGESILTPSRDLIVAPSVFLIAPDRQQIVRLGVSPAARGAQSERAYRLVVRELPSVEETPRSGLRVLLEMSLPVFVRPGGAAPELTLVPTRDASGAPAVRLSNTGASRVSLSVDAAGESVENLPRYLLAGSSIVRRIAPGQRRITIVYADAQSTAAQHRQFELDDAPFLSAHR